MNYIKNKLSFKKKWCLVTGATGHLGKTICYHFAELEANIIILDLDEKKCLELKKYLIKKFNIKVFICICDLQIEKERNSTITKIKKEIGNLDIIINNAALVGTSNLKNWITDFENQSLDSWRASIEVNLTAVFHLCQGLTPLLKKSKIANIVNISSIYGLLAPDKNLYSKTKMNNPAGYAISKAGLIQLTKWLSTTLSPSVRVNAIAPGGIFRNQNPYFIKKYNKSTPLNRMATEEDIAGGVIFFASELANYITGQVLSIDGGKGVW